MHSSTSTSNENKEKFCLNELDKQKVRFATESSPEQQSTGRKSYAERLCEFYVNKPKLAFAISLGIQVSFLMATGALYLLRYDIFPYDFTIVPLNLEKDSSKLRTDAFKFVTEDPRIDLLPTTAIPQFERTLKASPLELVYKAKYKNGNVLSTRNLRAIRDLENALVKEPSYRSICHRDERTNNCSLPMSIIRLFDGSLDKRLYDPEFKHIPMILTMAQNISALRPIISYALDKRSVIGLNYAHAKHCRSVLFNGLPLKGYKHGEDRKSEQLNVLKINVVQAFSEMLSEKYESGIGDMYLYYMNMDLFFNAVESQVVWDLLLAGGSLVFIFSFVWFQTGSLWITGWAVFGIITNFFGANLVYRIVLDFRFIGIFHVLSVFMILGIGADDVFVFFNTWKLMEARNFSTMTQHLTETFRVAAGAMFVTSLTTAAAFLASAASPLLGVSSFGVFSGILVIVNYISVCIYFPSVVVTYHYYWKDYRPFNCCPSKNKEIDRKLLAIQQNRTPDRHEAPQDEMTKMFKAIVRWFETFYANRVVLHSKVKWILLTLFGSLTITFFVYAMHIGPDEEQIQVWPKGTNWYDIRQLKLQAFEETGEGNNVIRIYTVWGLNLQDRTNCHFTDFRCKGRTVFDEAFNMNKPGCQEAILNFCRRLKNLPEKRARELHIRRSMATGDLEVSCFIDDMDKYFQSEYMEMLKQRFKYTSHSTPKDINFSIPMDAQKTRALMSLLPEVYNVSLLSKHYNRYFEVALGFWLSGGGHPHKKFDYYKYSSYMGGSLDRSVSNDKKSSNLSMAQGGIHGNRLRYVAVVVNTTLTGPTLKYTTGLEASKKWEQYMEEEVKLMPQSCNKPFQCTPEWNEWHWLKVQGELLKGAKVGIVIGLTLAFPVLVFTTCNLIIGLLATLTIALITICVVGLIPLVGWNLGVMESINLTLVVGLSVDYAVHLADGYVRCEFSDRQNRVRHMLGHVGVSVLAGAGTTLGASAFMLGSKILFFFQFGIFIFCTIGFSIVYALVVFTIIIGLIGPQGDNGSLMSIVDFFNRKNTARENSRAELVLHTESFGAFPNANEIEMEDKNDNDVIMMK